MGSRASPTLLANHSPRRAAYQAVKIFLPALPHGVKRAVHAHAHDAFAGTEPDAMASGLDAHGDSDVFEYFARDPGMAADRVIDFAADHQKLAVRGGHAGFRVIHVVVGEKFRQP